MRFLQIDHDAAVKARKAFCDAKSLAVVLRDGRTITVPLSWYPRLAGATPEERENYIIEDQGHAIHWPDIDEDISVEGILAGRRSEECENSLAKWRRWIVAARKARKLGKELPPPAMWEESAAPA